MAKPGNLEERVIALAPDVVRIFETLVGMLGRKGAAEWCELTPEQIDGLLNKHHHLRYAPISAYEKACVALNMQPEPRHVTVRSRRPTKLELSQHYTPLSDEILRQANRAVRGATIKQAAEQLRVSPEFLLNLLRGDHVAHIPDDLLRRIRERIGFIQGADFGADEHPSYKYSGYRRIGDMERSIIRMFLMGGNVNDAAEILLNFGRHYTAPHIERWLTATSGESYVHGLAYSLMAAIVQIRMRAGYYAIISDTRAYEKKPLHIRNTEARAKTIQRYSIDFSHNTRYQKAAEALGAEAKALKKMADGKIQYIPAWLYVRVLERMEGTGSVLKLSEEDRELDPFIGRSDDLERRLKDYSLAAMRQGFVADIAAIGSHFERPEQGMFALLQAVQHGYADQNTVSKIRILSEQSATIDTLIGALGNGYANRKALLRGLEYADPEVSRLLGEAAIYIEDPGIVV
ncbi:hypothetical protein HYU15_02165, partial [Candidatus Woesearchaeota archaeon]|nr:hypothetical protein [Candidatus Woesearchaeota archaeon]